MNKIIIFLFLLSVFIISFLPVKDTDFGWHYRCGKEFLTKGDLCTKNNFSYFLPNYKSAYNSLFYDISLAIIYDRFGFIGVSVVGALIMTLSAFIFINLMSGFLWTKFIFFYMVFYLSIVVFGLGMRSQIIKLSFFLTDLFYLKNFSKEFKIFFIFPFSIFHLG